MKKRVAAILLTGVLVAVLTGCGKNAEGTVPVSLVTEKTSDTAEDEAAQPSSEESGADETVQPSTEESGADEAAQPSTEESGADETAQPSSEESGADETVQPPSEEPETDEAAQPPAEEPETDGAAQPPAEESGTDGAAQPPAEESGMDGAVQPPVEAPADIPPEILEQIYAEFPEGAYVEIIVEESEPNGDRYTPEEAIAIYRSLMEAGGKIWDPSLKGNWDETLGLYPIEDWYNHMENYNGSSWGTGFIFLDKGMPEWAAGTDLESFAIGDGAGNPWTRYYLEVTGYDAECVYITAWH